MKNIFVTSLATLSLCLSTSAAEITNQIKPVLNKLNTKQIRLNKEFKEKNKQLKKDAINSLEKLQKKFSQPNNKNIKLVAAIQKQIETIAETIDKKVKLSDIKPISVYGSLEVNPKITDYSLPMIGGAPALSTYFAHAPSTLIYEIPKNVDMITGFGCCPPPKSWKSNGVKFIIKIDDRQVYRSPTIKGPKDLAKFNVKIPEDAKLVSFIVDPKESKTSDHSFWMDVMFTSE